MEQRRLGRTGHHSSVAVIGGAAFGTCTTDEAGEAIAFALEAGVNHIDIAPSYGHAELVAGPHIGANRDRLFVTEKTQRRSAEGARAQLEETLTRLGTDHVDVYQLHAVTDLDVLESRLPALEAILAARDEGLTRFVGITGHDLGAPAAHLEALRRFDLDTVMFPVFASVWADATYRRDAEALLSEAEARDVGVMAIKAVARRPWGDREKWAEAWYEPWDDQAAIDRAVRFTLSVPGVHAFCTPGDLAVMRRAIDAAARWTPMDAAERETTIADAAALDERSIFPLVENFG